MSTVIFGQYEWDDVKDAANQKKHGVAFREAATAFVDEHSLLLEDPQKNDGRFVLLGMSNKARILFVVHGEVINKKRTRIISARVANKQQALQYTLGDAP